MKKLLALIFAMSCALTTWAVPVTPIVVPHITFVDASGGPCAACSLFTYAAGSTTPLATYTDATGTSVNTNPVILDAAGGANIWLGANSYKFILEDAQGATIWSVDRVNAASLLPCGPASTIQIANSTVNGLTCDSSITINTLNHTLNIGTLPTNYMTIGPLGTPTSWTLDTTSPATVRSSIASGQVAAGTTGQYARYAADGSTVSGVAFPTLYYQTMQANGSNQTQQPKLDFLPEFTVANDAPNTRTTVDLAAAGTAGTYAYPTSMTTDAFGRVTSVTAGTTTTRICNANGCYRIEADGTIEAWGISSLVTGTPISQTLTITFPVAFTTTANLSLVTSITTDPSGDGNPHAADCHITRSTITTSGASAVASQATGAGGTGYSNLNDGDYCSWHAFGN